MILAPKAQICRKGASWRVRSDIKACLTLSLEERCYLEIFDWHIYHNKLARSIGQGCSDWAWQKELCTGSALSDIIGITRKTTLKIIKPSIQLCWFFDVRIIPRDIRTRPGLSHAFLTPSPLGHGRRSLFQLAVPRFFQPVIDILPSLNRLVFCRALLSDAGGQRFDDGVIVGPEENWDRNLGRRNGASWKCNTTWPVINITFEIELRVKCSAWSPDTECVRAKRAWLGHRSVLLN